MIVTLNGYVAADDDQWLYDFFGLSAFSPGIVRQAIAGTSEGEDLIVEINSGGGSVFAGFEIYSALRSAACRTVAHVQSLAASAASTIMCGCTEVLLSPVAQIMLHLPSLCTDGNRQAHRDSIRMLDSITQSILNGYELRCAGHTSRDELERLMTRETWIPAQEAVSMGLADGLLYQDEADGGALSAAVVNAVGGGIRALSFTAVPGPDALRANYEALVRAGAAPAPGHPVAPGETPVNIRDHWRAEARLRIEKSRFI